MLVRKLPPLTELIFLFRIDPSIRLRRAIHLNDLVLIERIVRHNPGVLRSRHYEDDNNTALHLAARLGYMDAAVRGPTQSSINTINISKPNTS